MIALELSRYNFSTPSNQPKYPSHMVKNVSSIRTKFRQRLEFFFATDYLLSSPLLRNFNQMREPLCILPSGFSGCPSLVKAVTTLYVFQMVCVGNALHCR